MLADQFIVVGMRSDPEPEATSIDVDRKGAIAQSDSDGPETADPLELQRRMPRIAFEKRISGVGKLSNRERQRLITDPEFG